MCEGSLLGGADPPNGGKIPSVQVTNARGQRPQGSEGLLADGEKARVLTPAVVEPDEAEDALGAARDEAGHAAAAERIDPGRAAGHDGELPLDLGVLRPECQELLERRGAQAVLLEVGLDIGRVRNLAQVDELELNLDDALAPDGEVPRVDEGVLPVVLAVAEASPPTTWSSQSGRGTESAEPTPGFPSPACRDCDSYWGSRGTT